MSRIPAEVDELTVGQLAARSGVAVSALRFYEAEGLIASRRTEGNQRRFRRDTLRRVAFIKAAQHVGMPLREVKAMLDRLGSRRTPTRQDWARLSAGWREDLEDRIRHLEALRDRLSGCIGCGCLSIDRCRLVNPDDELGEEGPGARTFLGPRAAGAGP
ncbi:MAG TPA: redox-sensitive transcriptional activator SoxR [Acidimicrobiales bacterium]|nr:redox-sensitive transcriptional activator SoxR [Acidimicrobiales bacterium]